MTKEDEPSPANSSVSPHLNATLLANFGLAAALVPFIVVGLDIAIISGGHMSTAATLLSTLNVQAAFFGIIFISLPFIPIFLVAYLWSLRPDRENPLGLRNLLIRARGLLLIIALLYTPLILLAALLVAGAVNLFRRRFKGTWISPMSPIEMVVVFSSAMLLVLTMSPVVNWIPPENLTMSNGNKARTVQVLAESGNSLIVIEAKTSTVERVVLSNVHRRQICDMGASYTPVWALAPVSSFIFGLHSNRIPSCVTKYNRLDPWG